jgi:hypothetical protein
MKYTPEQEISETNETDVYKPRETCRICPIASRCAVKNYPPCNMKMVAIRERAADGMISDVFLQRYEAEYRGE